MYIFKKQIEQTWVSSEWDIKILLEIEIYCVHETKGSALLTILPLTKEFVKNLALTHFKILIKIINVVPWFYYLSTNLRRFGKIQRNSTLLWQWTNNRSTNLEK